MDSPDDSREISQILKRLTGLEERMARIEQQIRTLAAGGELAVAEEEEPAQETGARPGEEDEFEFEVGQNWFAKVGIVVLALGIAFLLTFPYAGFPPAAPALFGYMLAACLFLVARLWRTSFDLVSRYLRGAGMILLFFTTLRLSYFGPEPVLEASSLPGVLLLTGVLVVNMALAIRRESPYLFSLALTTGVGTALAVGTSWFLLSLLTLLCLATVSTCLRFVWPGVLLYASLLVYPCYLLWAIGNPVLGNEVGIVASPAMSVAVLLGFVVILAAGTLFRNDRSREGALDVGTSLLNGGAGYAVFLLHTLGAFESSLPESHLVASAVFLGLAIFFWVREKSRYSTFIYSMLGYSALSVAIMKSFDVPVLFVLLSAESLIVVATAIWFRSRFIVVANFIIFLMTMGGYLVVAKEETGISLGFGLVALASARILNWQQDRLELKTESMRNAYLASALAVFPYATYHLVPSGYVSLSWVGIAVFYYLMSLLIRKQKYRWMGHLTLILTVLYVVIIGISQLDPTYRIISFLVLGTVLLVVSLVFTRLRARQRKERESEEKPQETE